MLRLYFVNVTTHDDRKYTWPFQAEDAEHAIEQFADSGVMTQFEGERELAIKAFTRDP